MRSETHKTKDQRYYETHKEDINNKYKTVKLLKSVHKGIMDQKGDLSINDFLNKLLGRGNGL